MHTEICECAESESANVYTESPYLYLDLQVH